MVEIVTFVKTWLFFYLEQIVAYWLRLGKLVIYANKILFLHKIVRTLAEIASTRLGSELIDQWLEMTDEYFIETGWLIR